VVVESDRTAQPQTGLNDLVQRAARRAENAPEGVLRDAFVAVPGLVSPLETDEHHVVFGRRGTGKTHLLRHLQAQQAAAGALTVYLDLRQVGIAGDVFSVRQENFSELATGLLIDVVEQIHAAVYEQVVSDTWSPYLTALSGALDALSAAATEIRVVGETELESQRESIRRDSRGSSLEVSAPPTPHITVRAESARERSRRSVQRRVDRGRETHHVLLGPLSAAFRALAAAVRPHRVWLLVDEWSALPLELQPLLADLLRRTMFATSGIVVKIGAIHGRSEFADVDAEHGSIGLELGADTAASLDLDDFLLFRNDTAMTVGFYSTLLCRHMTAMSSRAGHAGDQVDRLISSARSPAQLTKLLFATPAAFQALVLGAEGVPRDFLQIAGLAAAMAHNQPINVKQVNEATRNFFLRDKETRIPKLARPAFAQLMEQSVRQKSRIIPLRRSSESSDDVIEKLYDARVIHRVRQGLCLDAQHPTEMYDVYVIDAGAFLGLITAGKIRPVDDGLDPGARFADIGEIEARGRSFAALPRHWYRAPPRSRR